MQPKSINQTGPQTFTVVWKDAVVMEYRLADVQKSCPCAHCRKVGAKVQEEVNVRSIETVGRYGLRFTFVTGCDRGVYTYSLLRRIGRQLKSS